MNTNQKEKNRPALSISSITMAVCAVVGIALTAAPVYWGYMCRTSGTWCDGSIVPPRTSDDGRKAVADRIASDLGGKAFTGLSVRQAGFWPFSTRLDVVANFQGDKEIAVDTLPDDASNFQLFQDQNLAFAGLVVNKRTAAFIISYFPHSRFAKRVFEFWHHGASKIEISISNPAYVESKRRIVFDIRSSYPWITVNNSQSTQFKLSGYSTDESFGGTIAMNLSDTFHVNSIYPVSNEEKYAKSEMDFESCKAGIAVTHQEDGDLSACQRNQTSDLNAEGRALTVFEWSNKKLNAVADQYCDLPYWVLDPSKKEMFSTCDQSARSHRYGEKEHSSTWLSVYKKPFDEITYFFDGDCKDLSIFNIRKNGNSALVFELQTDCKAITISDRIFELPSKSNTTRVHDFFELVFDSGGLPVSLKPYQS